MFQRTIALGTALLLLGACSADRNPAIDPVGATTEPSSAAASSPDANERTTEDGSKETKAVATAVDPRDDGFEIALGEWAVTPEAPAIRPGEVTFVIHNRGTMPHGFEIELEGESSGSGSGELFKAESKLLQPGESTRMTVELTQTGVYKIECLVDGHDDMGMEGPLEVSRDAPMIKSRSAGAPSQDGRTEVAITNFAFDPGTIEVDTGTEITWANDDPAPHTVTSLEDDFDSGTLEAGKSFSFTFDRPGTYDYRCEVHPDMEGTVKVR